jgi:pyridoxal biosynthesis lyase PdxS
VRRVFVAGARDRHEAWRRIDEANVVAQLGEPEGTGTRGAAVVE